MLIATKRTQVGTFETMEDSRAEAIMSDRIMSLTLLPKRFSRNMRMRSDSGTIEKASAMPNDARIKKTTGFANPVSAVPKSGVICRSGKKASIIQQETESGRLSAMRRMRNAAVKPIVLIAIADICSVPGMIKATAITVAAAIPPTILFVCLLGTTIFGAFVFDNFVIVLP
jgi:hypothetical protein